MALYGHEIDETTTPFEAGLGWVVKLDKGDFLGRDALAAQKAAGHPAQAGGFRGAGAGNRPPGSRGCVGRRPSGRRHQRHLESHLREGVGAWPTCPPDLAAPGTALTIDVRGKALPAVVVEAPFYKRSRDTASMRFLMSS